MIQQQEMLKKTAEGAMFTDFTIEQPDGSKVSLSDYVGKVNMFGRLLGILVWSLSSRDTEYQRAV